MMYVVYCQYETLLALPDGGYESTHSGRTLEISKEFDNALLELVNGKQHIDVNINNGALYITIDADSREDARSIVLELREELLKEKYSSCTIERLSFQGNKIRLHRSFQIANGESSIYIKNDV